MAVGGRGRRAAGVAADGVLWLAAIGGAICIVLVVAAVVLDVSVIMFKTGSMAPTMPTGTAALVREIPAAQVRVGDVVTVDRPGRLPITHRVVGVEDVPGQAAERDLTLRGDANAVDDPAPYRVDSARRVLVAVPGLAYGLVWLTRPPVMLVGLTLLALLIGWAFWPRGADEEGQEAADEAGGDAAGVDGAPEPVEAAGGHGRAASASLLVLVAALGVAPAVLVPSRAAAAEVEHVVQGRVLRLTTVSDSAMSTMVPGIPARWEVGVSADPPSPGTVVVRVSAGAVPDPAFRVRVAACDVRWQRGTCARGGRQLVPSTSPVPSGVLATVRMPAADQVWIAVSMELTGAAQQVTRDITVRATGSGDDLAVGPGGAPPAPTAGPPPVAAAPVASGGAPAGGLASTGSAVAALAALGLGLGAVGAALLARARRAGPS